MVLPTLTPFAADASVATLQALEGAPTPLDGKGTPGGGSSSPFGGMMPFVLLAVVFWFVLLAPERKARKKRESMLAALQKGDKVMTNGGLYGTVAAVQDQVVTLTVADGVRMRFARSAIQAVVADEAPKEASAS